MKINFKFLLTAFCLFISIVSYAQKYAKVKISLIGRDLNELAKAGIETDHGIYAKNRYFISDFSEGELDIINKLSFETEVLIEDVSSYYATKDRPTSLLETASRNINCKGSKTSEYPYQTPIQYRPGTMGGYFTYDDMLSILDTMAMRYPHLITAKLPVDTINTYGGRQIYYVKVSDDVMNDDNDKPQVLYTALHHAREPNSLSQMIFFLWYLLENYDSDHLVKKIVDETEMYFIPCVNPDGYVQNQTTHPNGGGLWRKNMWRNAAGELKGVDLNRNYGYFWGIDNTGSSGNPNSQVYRGGSAFSEPETQAIRTFCMKHDFKIAQNYHTFGNYLIHPWGYNDQPTAEDRLFKSMGNVMNRENNFKMGTGSETVGYVVNGDADDWMYGAADEKNPIYAYTPEVGPTFWPAQIDIDYLNRSCVWMNMATALLTLNYYQAVEEPDSPFLTSNENKIRVRVSRAGLKDGLCEVSLQSDMPDLVIKNPKRKITLNAGEDQILIFETELTQPFASNEIEFSLNVENDGILTSSKIFKTWVDQPFEKIFENKIDEISGFVSDGWHLTTESFQSALFSATDSPDALYGNDAFGTITTKEPIDLSTASYAILEYYAKWDIEDNYDYVQILASTDNRDFIPLCGKYTNFGTRDQQFGSPLYDGTQLEWVKEEIDLNQFIGNRQVWFRFLIETDEFEQRDGFYFDDMVVKAAFPVISSVNNINSDLNIFPSVSDGLSPIFIVDHKNTLMNGSMMVRGKSGQTMGIVPIVGGVADIKVLNLTSGMYFIHIVDGMTPNKVTKLVIK